MSWDRLSVPAMRRLQARRLRRFLSEQVYPFSAHYGGLWNGNGADPRKIRRVSDLARFPFTTKHDLAKDPRSFVLQPTPEAIRARLPRPALLRLMARRLLAGRENLKRSLAREYAPTSVFFTTGRTNAPTPVLLTPTDEAFLTVAGRRMVEVLRLSAPDDKGMNLFPCAPHLAFWQVVACGRASGILSLHSGGGRAMGTGKILQLIARMKPTFIVGVPGYTFHLLRRAKEEGVDLSSVRVVATGGEAQTPALRERLLRLLPEGARVVNVYGFTEARQCWAECAPGTGFHTYPDLGVFEVVHPETGEPQPPETTGELVYTGLDGRGSALVRYRTGDIAHGGVTYAPCPACGRQVPRVSSSLTRRDDGFVNIKGTLVDLNVLGDAVTSDPRVQEWQAEVTGEGAFEIRVAMPEEAIDGLVRRVRRAIEVRPDRVRIEPLGELVARLGLETEMKEVRFLDRRVAPTEVRP